jgi:hypothetical protein
MIGTEAQFSWGGFRSSAMTGDREIRQDLPAETAGIASLPTKGRVSSPARKTLDVVICRFSIISIWQRPHPPNRQIENRLRKTDYQLIGTLSPWTRVHLGKFTGSGNSTYFDSVNNQLEILSWNCPDRNSIKIDAICTVTLFVPSRLAGMIFDSRQI